VRNATRLVCGLLLGGWSAVQAQTGPHWSISAGPAFVFRTVQSSSPGIDLRAARVVTLSHSVYSEFGLTWHGYLSSDWADHGEDAAPCPIEGCSEEPARNGISVLGVEAGGGFRKAGAENPIFPVAGVGLYRVSAHDTTGIRFGLNLGIVVPFSSSAVGPGLDIRYFRMFGDSRFKSLLPFSLRWSF
jgi:hypothetical protein